MQGDLIAAFQYLKGAYKKDGDSIFSRACSDKTTAPGEKKVDVFEEESFLLQFLRYLWSEDLEPQSIGKIKENSRKKKYWETVPKGKGVQEGWTFFKKETLKAQEQAVPTCQKTSQRGRQPAWLNRELWLELRKKKRVYDFWKKGQATQEDYKDVVRLCREKIRRVIAQLELNLATAVKDNKKCFYKCFYSTSNKRRAKQKIQPLLDAGGNIVTKDEEKAEVLNAFFASVFNSKASCSRGTQPPEQEHGDRQQNEAPVTPGEMVSDLLHHLDTHTSIGARWDPPKGTEGAGRSAHQATFNPLSAVLANLGGPS
ncbi:hypothetical protein QYF61_001402 [Mycteria americana]|uniref:Uncharacterized protein n=1 Tax=Mycteria americana TaxID=33587 RepID=A0AAN7MXL2_MYCAM|nr:hypothetical protein QYF61_001402 [Mycteria americana]